MLKNYVDSKWKWHPIINFRCQRLSLAMNIFALWIFSILFLLCRFSFRSGGPTGISNYAAISEIEEVVTKLNVKILHQPFAM